MDTPCVLHDMLASAAVQAAGSPLNYFDPSLHIIRQRFSDLVMRQHVCHKLCLTWVLCACRPPYTGCHTPLTRKEAAGVHYAKHGADQAAAEDALLDKEPDVEAGGPAEALSAAAVQSAGLDTADLAAAVQKQPEVDENLQPGRDDRPRCGTAVAACASAAVHQLDPHAVSMLADVDPAEPSVPEDVPQHADTASPEAYDSRVISTQQHLVPNSSAAPARTEHLSSCASAHLSSLSQPVRLLPAAISHAASPVAHTGTCTLSASAAGGSHLTELSVLRPSVWLGPVPPDQALSAAQGHSAAASPRGGNLLIERACTVSQFAAQLQLAAASAAGTLCSDAVSALSLPDRTANAFQATKMVHQPLPRLASSAGKLMSTSLMPPI